MEFDNLLERFASAVAAGDTAGFAALFTADGCYDDGFFGLHRGREGIAAMLTRFHVGGERFRWQFFEPLATERLGYARYCFGYRSKEKESAGALVVFDGMARLRLRDGLIADYAEVFDRGMAFVQLGYDAPRVHKLLGRYVQAWRASDAVREHLRWREAQEAGDPEKRSN
jgi:SnoaL-like domain